VWSGAIDYNIGAGKLFKDQITSDISTLLTFTYPQASAGLTCHFEFALGSASILQGTPAFDVFSSLAPATASTTSWPPGNLRNNHLARMDAVLGGFATYEGAGFPQTAASFLCPPPGTVEGWELVPTGDATDIEWIQSGLVGAFISYA
jgi:hypothetical protein